MVYVINILAVFNEKLLQINQLVLIGKYSIREAIN